MWHWVTTFLWDSWGIDLKKRIVYHCQIFPLLSGGTPASEYDAVIVGGGHNGLVAASYLARCGVKTAVLERRHVLGKLWYYHIINYHISYWPWAITKWLNLNYLTWFISFYLHIYLYMINRLTDQLMSFVPGGAAVTEEIVPGYKFSRASYVLSLLRPQIFTDLELKKHGLKVWYFPMGFVEPWLK